jgi:hypothetical protein
MTVISKASSNRWVGTPSPGLLSNPTSPCKRGEVNKTAPLLHLSPRAGRGRIALAIRVRGRLNEGGRYDFKNTRHIAKYVIIPEPQHPVFMIGKPFVTHDIARVICVLSPVNFNNKTMFATDKIDGVGADRFLPDEFVAIKPARPQPEPKCGFRLGNGSSQSPRSSGLDCIGFSHAATPPHPDHRFAMIRPLPARGERLAQRSLT